MQKLFSYHRCLKTFLILAGKYKKITKILVILRRKKTQEIMVLRNESKYMLIKPAGIKELCRGCDNRRENNCSPNLLRDSAPASHPQFLY